MKRYTSRMQLRNRWAPVRTLEIGERFGLFTIVAPPSVETGHMRHYRVRCDCGALRWKTHHDLVRKNPVGCFTCTWARRREETRQRQAAGLHLVTVTCRACGTQSRTTRDKASKRKSGLCRACAARAKFWSGGSLPFARRYPSSLTDIARQVGVTVSAVATYARKHGYEAAVRHYTQAARGTGRRSGVSKLEARRRAGLASAVARRANAGTARPKSAGGHRRALRAAGGHAGEATEVGGDGHRTGGVPPPLGTLSGGGPREGLPSVAV